MLPFKEPKLPSERTKLERWVFMFNLETLCSVGEYNALGPDDFKALEVNDDYPQLEMI